MDSQKDSKKRNQLKFVGVLAGLFCLIYGTIILQREYDRPKQEEYPQLHEVAQRLRAHPKTVNTPETWTDKGVTYHYGNYEFIDTLGNAVYTAKMRDMYAGNTILTFSVQKQNLSETLGVRLRNINTDLFEK